MNSSDLELHTLKDAYEDHHRKFNPSLGKTREFTLEGKQLLDRLNAYKSTHKLPIHTRKGKSQKHTHTHERDVHLMTLMGLYLDHEHPHTASESKNHVKKDYQKLKNSVDRILKNKMIQFPADSPGHQALLAIKIDKTHKTKIIQDGPDDEEKKRSKMTSLLTNVKQKILEVNAVSGTKRGG
jgi:hypothetical protein